MKKRCAALLFAVLFCLTLLPLQAFARQTDHFSSLPSDFDFAALRFDSKCVEDLKSVCSSTSAMLPHLGREQQLCAAFDQITALRTEADTQLTLITILYHQNPGLYAEEYSAMNTGVNSASQLLAETVQAILADPVYSQVLIDYAGMERISALLEQNATTAEQTAIKDAETELVMQYQRLSAEDQGVYVNGQYWTLRGALSAYHAEELSYADYLEIAHAAYAERNAVLGQIYLELIPLRNQYAASCGGTDCASYAYSAVYGRDYTLEDAALFRESVKTHLVPLFQQLQKAVDHGYFGNGIGYEDADEAALLDAIEPYIGEVSDELAEAFAYMRRCDLIDAEYSNTKLPVSFTRTLSAYDAAYVLCNRYGDNRDLSTLTHEFGHFAAFCYGAGETAYDALEVHSQGLEALLLHYAAELYGDEAVMQTGRELYDLLLAISSGCMYDELQVYAYTTPELTLEMLNAKSAELCAAYGITPFGPEGMDYTWVEIPHSFDAPMYYISYATSAALALEIFFDAKTTGFEHAADCYLAFLANSADSYEFRSVTTESGLADPFEAKTLETLAQQLSDFLFKEVYTAPYTDVDDCWAKADIALLYLMGIMQGTSENQFSPDSTLTRGMAVTVLYRAVGAPQNSTAAEDVFVDVAEDSWYAEAVGWALETGVTRGTSETTFSPNQLLSCQEFAVMLFRTLYGADADYTDAEALEGEADWAVDAMAWSRDEAIFAFAENLPTPAQQLSRAELAAALCNMLGA